MIINTIDLTKKYTEKTAVNKINLSVKNNQIFGFLGPNGAGKSTLIKMLTGLVHPTSGDGEVLGRPLGDVLARRKMGYLPELFRYQDWMTGNDLLNFHSELFHLKIDKSRNENILKRVGLLGQEKFKIGTFSKGMQQRLGLACALLPEPELLFLDEPTSALDPIGRKEVRDIIVSLKKDGTTVFLNSHLLSEVESVCDNITIINKGEIVKSGSIKELTEEKIDLNIKATNINSEILQEFKQNFNTELKSNSIGNYVVILRSKEEIPLIASFLIDNGVNLYELTPLHETLESVFLKVIGEEGYPLKQ